MGGESESESESVLEVPTPTPYHFQTLHLYNHSMCNILDTKYIIQAYRIKKNTLVLVKGKLCFQNPLSYPTFMVASSVGCILLPINTMLEESGVGFKAGVRVRVGLKITDSASPGYT